MKITCPKCKTQMDVNEILKECFCSTCGQKIRIRQVDDQKGDALGEELLEDIHKLFETLPVEGFEYIFDKEGYEPSFREYQEKNKEVFDKIIELFDCSSKAEILFSKAVHRAVKRVRFNLKNGVSFFKRKKVTYYYDMSITVYLLPALLECGGSEYGQRITDIVIEGWGGSNNNQMKAGSFESINKEFNAYFFGFRIKK